MPEFTPWPKTPRLFRDVVVTEKLDGTNAAIQFHPAGEFQDGSELCFVASLASGTHSVAAQSRNRLVTPEADNHGFAAWVYDNAASLFEDLGPGTHFGEWWGQGINRGYGLKEKRFSLFNTAKWDMAYFKTPQLYTVPVVARDSFDTLDIEDAAQYLHVRGSIAAPGFMNPEGICVYHTAARQVFKYTFNGDGHKG